MRMDEVEGQQEPILRAPQLVRDSEYLFSDDLIMDNSSSVDVTLPVFAKFSALIEALRLGGSYNLVHQLWSQFTPVPGQVNVDVTTSRDEVLVSELLMPYCT